MSLSSWKREFYKTPASKVSRKFAVKHSLRKWIGLKSSNRKRHGIALENSFIMDKNFNRLAIATESCALCQHYSSNCYNCPLAIANNGFPCDESCGDEPSAYGQFAGYNLTSPMIKLLEKAFKNTKR